jgi:hypothetical protein
MTTAVRSRSPKKQTSEKIASVHVERKAIEDLVPHPRNEEIRKHPEVGSPKWEALKKSLENDYFDPIVWNKRNGMLVSGHLRTKLLGSMGYTHVDVSVVDYDENTHLARLFAANRWMGDEDPSGQRELLRELGTDPEFDFGVAGFTEEELTIWGVFTDAAGFDGVDTDDDDDEDEGVSESGLPASDVKYLQLVYSAEDYARVREMLEDYKQRNATELEGRFGMDERFMLPNILTYFLEQERADNGLGPVNVKSRAGSLPLVADADVDETPLRVDAPRKRSRPVSEPLHGKLTEGGRRKH